MTNHRCDRIPVSLLRAWPAYAPGANPIRIGQGRAPGEQVAAVVVATAESWRV
ncbi:MAG: hypothetical protein ABI628_06690 [Chloroflexota bacterium]